jgi:hypothetical protein
MIYSGKVLPRNKIPEREGMTRLPLPRRALVRVAGEKVHTAQGMWKSLLSYVVVTVPGIGAPEEHFGRRGPNWFARILCGTACKQPSQRFTVSSSNQLVICEVITSAWVPRHEHIWGKWRYSWVILCPSKREWSASRPRRFTPVPIG